MNDLLHSQLQMVLDSVGIAYSHVNQVKENLPISHGALLALLTKPLIIPILSIAPISYITFKDTYWLHMKQHTWQCCM